MQQAVFDYKKNRSELYLKYQVDLDETSSSILFIIQEEQKKLFGEQSQLLEEATRKINASKSSLQVDTKNPRAQAFWVWNGKVGAGPDYSNKYRYLFLCLPFKQRRGG